MKPHAVMLELRPLDARKQDAGKPFKFPHIELDNLVFLRVPEDKMQAMQMTGDMESFRNSIMQAAGASGKTYLEVPSVINMIDTIVAGLTEGEEKQSKISVSDVVSKLSMMRDEVSAGALPTNKTFIFLPETVRFLEVKEKWEVME